MLRDSDSTGLLRHAATRQQQGRKPRIRVVQLQFRPPVNIERSTVHDVLVVVVDGGSDDPSLEIARDHADLAFRAPRGRGVQMNAGAAACLADALLFLHADSRLPENAGALVAQALRGPRHWGRFDVHIHSPRAALRLVERTMNLRSRLTGIATGDQMQWAAFPIFR